VTERKPDAPQIESFIGSLAESLSLDSARAWWPNYLFHTTELKNAIRILETGQLLSRHDIGDDMPWENANREIIERTPADVLDNARFYFRPRTPMTHNNEGFRTKPNRHQEAYCPLPVMLVYPAVPLLTAVGTQFSDGNCSSRSTQRGDTAEFLWALPFVDIYDDSPWLAGEEWERIKKRRQAEVLVPSPFPYRPQLLQIRLRSVAERDTLLTLLESETAERYRNQILVSSKQRLFHKLWTYVESVSALGNQLTVRFNESTSDKSDFQIRLQLFALDGTLLTESEGRRPTVEPLRLTVRGPDLERHPYRLQIELEGELAYSGVLDPRPQQLLVRQE
jgi:hypothetical protein